MALITALANLAAAVWRLIELRKNKRRKRK
jgi:hypothetical protein